MSISNSGKRLHDFNIVNLIIRLMGVFLDGALLYNITQTRN